MDKFYVTTPIYYVNAVPHIGTAYSTIIADTFARYYRLKGVNTFFSAGVDENSIKTVKASGKDTFEGIQEYTDKMSKTWQDTWKKLNISNDAFVRTTSKEHTDFVNKFVKKMKKDDIYKGKYEGHYCEGCEAYYVETDLVDGNCPTHKKPTVWLEEDNYFFKLSAYQDQLLKYIEDNPNFIQPEFRKKEIVNFISSGLKDISISRPKKVWGMPFTLDDSQVFYIWIEALVNYLSCIDVDTFWPADLHIVGKDIQKFHCIIWPAMLFSAGYDLPKTVYSHGFFTIDGEKISKSLGNAINPLDLQKKFGNDSIRYYLLREIPFGNDGDFSEESLKNRHNNELANDLGNLLSRVLAMIEKYNEGVVPEGVFDNSLQVNFNDIDSAIKNNNPHLAIELVWKYINEINRYVNDKAPWELAKDKPDELNSVLYSLAEALRYINILITPFLPETSEKMSKQLNLEVGSFEDLVPGKSKGVKITKGDNLFEKID